MWSAARYGLDGPGIEFRWGDLPRPSRQVLGRAPSLLYSGCRVSLPGVKQPGRGVDHPSQQATSTEVKEGVELSFYFPSGPSWPLLGVLVESLNEF